MRTRITSFAALILLAVAPEGAQRYVAPNGALRVALAQQPLGPNGPTKGPDTMANGGLQAILAELGATVRVERAELTSEQATEYGGWKRLGMSLGHFDDIVGRNERDGYFTVGLLATCPSSEQLARLFEQIFARYPKASAIGFATIRPTDEGGWSIAALNRMIAGAVRGVAARSAR